MKTRKSYSCEVCGHHVHPTAGTIFEKSSTPLTIWFEAIFYMTATRSGISAKQLERTLGVTYKTAWRMFHQIRKMMADDSGMLTGEVEIDETYFHPNPQRRTTAEAHDSQTVVGMVERGGRAKAVHVKDASYNVLIPEIEDNVDKSSVMYTDGHRPYKQLRRHGYAEHHIINHSKEQYVRGDVYTQNVENLWSNMKRGVYGVYRHIDPKYLQAYIDEYAFRYSHRKDFQPMFWILMGKITKTS
jgi:transposase-like protein